MVDPWYYLVQLTLFPLAGVIFGYFLNALAVEISTSGWVLSPRCVWRWCLAVSSFLFCVLELDPFSVLGILPTAWRIGVEVFIAAALLNSASSTFFMYVIVLSKQHLSKASSLSLVADPNLWVISNVIATIAIFFFALAGAITNNAFWFGLALFTVATQELILLVVVNVTLHKVGGLLKELEALTKVDYKLQRRKLWIIRIVTSGVIIFDICNQYTKEDSFLNGVLHPAPPMDYNPEVFKLTAPVLSVVMAVIHLTFLYAMHRPAESSRPATTAIALQVNIEPPSKPSAERERPSSKLSVTERPSSKQLSGRKPSLTPEQRSSSKLSVSVVVVAT